METPVRNLIAHASIHTKLVLFTNGNQFYSWLFLSTIFQTFEREFWWICSKKNNVNATELNRPFVCQLLIINEPNRDDIHEGYEIETNLHFRSACQIFRARKGFEALRQRATVRGNDRKDNHFLEIVVYYTAKRRISSVRFIHNNEGSFTARVHVRYVFCYFSKPCWWSNERERDDQYNRWVDLHLTFFSFDSTLLLTNIRDTYSLHVWKQRA